MASRIVWQRFDIPGFEFSALDSHPDGWRLSGTAVLAQNEQPCRVDYSIACSLDWYTHFARITAHIGPRSRWTHIRRGTDGVWQLDGVHVPAVDGCIDIDLGFSPSTNLLPIRRLALAVGDRAAVRAAWVRFPELTMEPLEQVYTRLDEHRYRYESAGGSFRKDLLVDIDGHVLDYPQYWRAHAATRMYEPAD